MGRKQRTAFGKHEKWKVKKEIEWMFFRQHTNTNNNKNERNAKNLLPNIFINLAEREVLFFFYRFFTLESFAGW